MYQPQTGEEGFGLLKAALRAYLAADLSANGLPSIVSLLPSGSAGITDEGFLREGMETPVVLFTTTGHGEVAGHTEDSLVRLILYVIDRGRGLSKIEQIIHRLLLRLNSTDVGLEYLTFPSGAGLVVDHIDASGSSSSVSLPAWKAEGRAVYVFLTVKGLHGPRQ